MKFSRALTRAVQAQAPAGVTYTPMEIEDALRAAVREREGLAAADHLNILPKPIALAAARRALRDYTPAPRPELVPPGRVVLASRVVLMCLPVLAVVLGLSLALMAVGFLPDGRLGGISTLVATFGAYAVIAVHMYRIGRQRIADGDLADYTAPVPARTGAARPVQASRPGSDSPEER